MSRIFFTVLSIFMIQAMAAPFTRRAVPSDPACPKLLDQAQTSSVAAVTALGDLNPVNDVFGTGQSLLSSQLALFNANSIVGPVVLSFDLASLAPAGGANSTASFFAALKSAQTALSTVIGTARGNASEQALLQGSQNLTQALSLAQQAVDLNCVALAAPASASGESPAAATVA
ncbi:hypothetical protein MVEN_01149700 [Mycena venus]|uniref:Cell wall protein n=1 Tax=Mycena venus TaxID=2733690 RepID=A0A8H7CXS5_9AGAR|nr:hypothetical protein MVEN_01149700 [Mycena venus]